MYSMIYSKRRAINARILTDIVDATYQFPDFDLKQLRDALSTGQIGSKLWLLNEFEKVREHYYIKPWGKINILIVGGWIGTLSRILFENMIDINITSIDIDDQATQMARAVHQGNEKFTAITRDMFDFDSEDYEDYDVIINTSCEHVHNLEDWVDKIPPHKIVIAQSNNFFACPQHVNCVASMLAFEKQLNLRDTHFSGELELPGTYTRYMVIGGT